VRFKASNKHEIFFIFWSIFVNRFAFKKAKTCHLEVAKRLDFLLNLVYSLHTQWQIPGAKGMHFLSAMSN
jgi:hypothetical protein